MTANLILTLLIAFFFKSLLVIVCQHLNTIKEEGMKCPSKMAKTHVKESMPLISEGGLSAPEKKSSYHY